MVAFWMFVPRVEKERSGTSAPTSTRSSRAPAPPTSPSSRIAVGSLPMALHGPALLFENIEDHQQARGTKLITAGMSNKAQVCYALMRPML
jgi:hypothetical protein